MKPTELIRSYIDAWNGRDANTLVSASRKDGTFCNPHTYPGLGGKALAEFVTAVWTAFPDLHLELLNIGEIEPKIVAIHWQLIGTNTAKGLRGRLQDEASQSREPPSSSLRAIRLSQISATLIEPILTDSLSRKPANDGGKASF
jgi:hypothetical protein